MEMGVPQKITEGTGPGWTQKGLDSTKKKIRLPDRGCQALTWSLKRFGRQGKLVTETRRSPHVLSSRSNPRGKSRAFTADVRAAMRF